MGCFGVGLPGFELELGFALGLGFGSGCLGLGIGFGLPWGLSVYLGAWICLETCCGLSPTMGFILGLGWITLE